MVQTFGTDSNNDIYIGRDGNLVVDTGLAAVMQACRNVSLAQLGEEVLTTKNGIPNFQTVWTEPTNYALFQNYLRQNLLAVPGVLEVTDIQITPDGHTLKYTATIRTIYGTTELTNG